MADILISHLFGTVPEIIEAYFSLPIPILKADFFRYLILLSRGGIYADIDTEALKSAHFWLPPTSPPNTVGLVIGIEADPTRDDWNLWYSRRVQFCQWVMRAKVGHPVVRGGGCANYGGDVGEETRGEVGGGVAEREFEYY